MFSHVNTPPWTHYRQSVNYCPLFILASHLLQVAQFSLIYGIYTVHSPLVARFSLIYGIYTAHSPLVARFSLIYGIYTAHSPLVA
ncbi:hypothetical protein, partial [Paenibacillus odorifer]|uniref:hypothetical protein n=1 Tax=Paenibacillus odorifer TaxID=189426 RepID=UPI00158B5848